MDGPIRIQQCLSDLSEGWDQGLPSSEKGYAQRHPPISLPSELTVCLLADKAALMLTPRCRKTTNMAPFGSSPAQVHFATGYSQGGTCVLSYLVFLVPVPGALTACVSYLFHC